MSEAILKLKSVCVPGVGTLGTISHHGDAICRTVEREWMNNEASVSCVPAGLYELVWADSPKYGRTFSLVAPTLGVTLFGPSQRTVIRIHAANFPNELQGCIGPGMAFHTSKFGVRDSRKGLKKFEEYVDTMLEIHERVWLDIERANAE